MKDQPYENRLDPTAYATRLVNDGSIETAKSTRTALEDLNRYANKETQ